MSNLLPPTGRADIAVHLREVFPMNTRDVQVNQATPEVGRSKNVAVDAVESTSGPKGQRAQLLLEEPATTK